MKTIVILVNIVILSKTKSLSKKPGAKKYMQKGIIIWRIIINKNKKVAARKINFLRNLSANILPFFSINFE